MKPPAPAQNVVGVLAQLDGIIADARGEASRLGYLAALYRLVTRQVADGITSPRIDHLHTNLENTHFAALSPHFYGRPDPKTCGVPFAAKWGGEPCHRVRRRTSGA